MAGEEAAGIDSTVPDLEGEGLPVRLEMGCCDLLLALMEEVDASSWPPDLEDEGGGDTIDNCHGRSTR
ncbi:hypothetical protein ACLOJK_037341 [Asimina triloba]